MDRYVAQSDPAYAWKLADTIRGVGYTTYILDLTSQSWRTAADVDRPVWKHWLTVVKPDDTKHSTAFLFIDGGSMLFPAFAPGG